MQSNTPESARQDHDEGPDGTTRDPHEDRPERQPPGTGGGQVRHDEPVPFPESDTAISQADGAA